MQRRDADAQGRRLNAELQWARQFYGLTVEAGAHRWRSLHLDVWSAPCPSRRVLSLIWCVDDENPQFTAVERSSSAKPWALQRIRAVGHEQPRVHWVPGLRDRLLDSETPPLSRSALVERRMRRSSLNGRLCPNALVSGDSRYDDVTLAGFVLVTCIPLSVQQREQLRNSGTEVLEVERGSALYVWLTDGKAAAAQVRPDFAVLRAGQDVGALCDAAPRFMSRNARVDHAAQAHRGLLR
jgi:hypothetical protein